MENPTRRLAYAGGPASMVNRHSKPTPRQRRRLAKKGTPEAMARRTRYAGQLVEARDRRRQGFRMAMLAAGAGLSIPAEFSKRVHMAAMRTEA